jgi:hypothetical protein
MIVWCSYCQKYLREVDPLEDYNLTHGVCDDCLRKNIPEDAAKITVAARVSALFAEARNALAEKNAEAFREAQLQLCALVPDSWDFTVGIMQPLLYEVGELWHDNAISVVDQHLYSAIFSNQLELMHAQNQSSQYLRNSLSPKILLLPASHNTHTFALKMLEFALMRKGIPSFLVEQAINVEIAMNLIADLKPDYVGISIALAPQWRYVTDLAQALSDDPRSLQTQILAGGFAVRTDVIPAAPAGISVFRDTRAFFDFLTRQA